MILKRLLAQLLEALATDSKSRSLLEESEFIGEMNVRTGRFDCGLNPGGFYEEDL